MTAALLTLVLVYPFVAAWLVGMRRTSALYRLEGEIEVLRRKIEALTPAPPPFVPLHVPSTDTPLNRPATTDSAVGPADQSSERQAAVETSAGPTSKPDDDVMSFPTFEMGAHDAERLEPIISQESASPPASVLGNAESRPPALDESITEQKSSTVTGAGSPASTLPGWAAAAKGWLFTGNLVAKLGLVILFIGVGFLLKYVAETVYVPIEVRLAGVVMATLALLVWGWRLRTARRELGLPIQGTAIAILMLVVFGAYQRYELMPAGFAFALLVALTAFTCLLAILQESPWLAAFGITGGFASPLLLSTGQANHIGLFSYYALLNAGVFALAIKRAWRPLNLIGFAFTFIVGSAWGGLHYTTANYGSAQGFLILFFLYYVGIAMGFARHQQTRLKDYVDAMLVLGTPLLAFALQVGLVKDKPFGLALSALVLSVFYLTLAISLWRRGGERWRVLVETFATLGVIFGTLAIPFALDGRWTSGMWALEGVGFVWLGLRRQQRSTWMFGVLLQAGAWMGFLGAATGLDPEAARSSNLWLGFLLLAGSAFAMARGFRQHGSDQPSLTRIANFCLITASGWLLAGAWTEAILRLNGSVLANSLAGGALLTAGLLYLSGARLAWPLARRLASTAQLAAGLAVVVVSASRWEWLSMRESDGGEPLLGVLMIALAAVATSFFSRRTPDPQTDRRFASAFLLWGGAWWFGPVLSIAAGRLLFVFPAALGAVDARWTAMYALVVGASAITCSRLAGRLDWPQLRWLGTGSWGMLALLTLPILIELYGMRTLPEPGTWLAWAMLWGSGEYVLLRWMADEALIQGLVLRAVHAVRTAGPWLAIGPTGSILLERWLAGGGEEPDAAARAGWAVSPAWESYIPTWAMMLVLAWLLKRSLAGTWPTAPVAQWYRRIVIPSFALPVLALVVIWNLLQDGTMAPLPYLPLLNPLDLTTGFALLLVLGAVKPLATTQDESARKLRIGGLGAAYAWFNLILLRSAAQYRGIPYRFDDLLGSQFVQAMLSLVWCASALVLMRYAARKTLRGSWCLGAALLGIVVLKLFTVDLASSGSLARVVSFVGVGLLMVLIGYFAPFPKTHGGNASAISSA